MKKIFVTFAFFFASSLAFPCMAAEVFATYPLSSVSPGSSISVPIELYAKGTPINAIEGNVRIPANMRLESVSDAGTFVSIWIERPNESDSVLRFSGIIPGGFEGVLTPYSQTLSAGRLFTLKLKAVSEGIASIVPEITNAYQNDADQSRISVSSRGTTIYVKAESQSINEPELKDTKPPEAFKAVIGRDKSLFDGRYFVTFATRDGESGMYFYTVEEGSREAETAVSPYLLKDQSLKLRIIVRAYDQAGNYQESWIEPVNEQVGMDLALTVIFIILAVSAFFALIKRLR